MDVLCVLGNHFSYLHVCHLLCSRVGLRANTLKEIVVIGIYMGGQIVNNGCRNPMCKHGADMNCMNPVHQKMEVNMVANFRKKPVMIKAVQWNGKNVKELSDFTNGDFYQSDVDMGTSFASVKTMEGKLCAMQFDWIIKGIQGEHYPCKPDIFHETYERIECMGENLGRTTD